MFYVSHGDIPPKRHTQHRAPDGSLYGHVAASGSGSLLMPSIDGKTERLPGAIQIEGQTSTLLSLKQLELAGYTLKWSNTDPIEIIRPDGSPCAILRREEGRLVWRPNHRQRQILSTKSRDWHGIFGHPGPRPLAEALSKAGITGYKPPEQCATCDKSKMTRKLGHGSLRTTDVFGKHLHMDLVGGQRSLLPPNSSGPAWYLLVVDEATAWKWGFSVESKKQVPQLIENLLQHIQVQHDIKTARIHCDAGTEFLNDTVRKLLNKRGIVIDDAASKAPEQNDIIERNVRTVGEKMRALALQSGLDLKLWPLILSHALELLNYTPNTVAKVSPFEAIYGKESRSRKPTTLWLSSFMVGPQRK